MTTQTDDPASKPHFGVAVFTYSPDGTKRVCIRCEGMACPMHGTHERGAA